MGYGRELLFLVTAAKSLTELKGNVTFAVRQILKGNLSAESRASVAQWTVRAVEGGGTGTPASFLRPLEDPASELAAYVSAGQQFSRANPGVPVTFRAAYLSNLQPVVVGSVARYSEVVSAEAPDAVGLATIGQGRDARRRATIRDAEGRDVIVRRGDTVEIGGEGYVWSGVLLTGDTNADG